MFYHFIVANYETRVLTFLTSIILIYSQRTVYPSAQGVMSVMPRPLNQLQYLQAMQHHLVLLQHQLAVLTQQQALQNSFLRPPVHTTTNNSFSNHTNNENGTAVANVTYPMPVPTQPTLPEIAMSEQQKKFQSHPVNIKESHITKRPKKETTCSVPSEQPTLSSLLVPPTYSKPSTKPSSVLTQVIDNKSNGQVIEVENPGSTSGGNSTNSNNHRNSVLNLSELSFEQLAKDKELTKTVSLRKFFFMNLIQCFCRVKMVVLTLMALVCFVRGLRRNFKKGIQAWIAPL